MGYSHELSGRSNQNTDTGMKAGDLVRIRRSSIGIPMESLALIVDRSIGGSGVGYWTVKFIGGKLNGKTRRFLTQDLRRIK